jgi:hypothetical protein
MRQVFAAESLPTLQLLQPLPKGDPIDNNRKVSGGEVLRVDNGG